MQKNARNCDLEQLHARARGSHPGKISPPACDAHQGVGASAKTLCGLQTTISHLRRAQPAEQLES